MQFVDTNIFIRFLTKDDPKKAEACFDLLQRAEKGEINLQTTESITAETVYVLESKRLYDLSKKEIYQKLFPLLKIKGLKITYKKSLILALDIYLKWNLDFEDAILIAHSLRVGSKEIYSYDRSIDKFSGVKRLEP